MAEWFKVEISFGEAGPVTMPPRAVTAVCVSNEYIDNAEAVSHAIDSALEALVALANGVRPITRIPAILLALSDPDRIHPDNQETHAALVALCDAADAYQDALDAARETPPPPVVDNN